MSGLTLKAEWGGRHKAPPEAGRPFGSLGVSGRLIVSRNLI
jgi:hypothetical protein